MKKKSTWIIVCVAVIFCLISVIYLSPLYFTVREFVLTKRPNAIAADAVTILHSTDGRVYSEEATITDQETVSELMAMHNSLKILEMSRPLAAENRKCVVFYNDDEIVTEWHVSLCEDDGMVITSSDTFGVGNHVVKSDFNYDRIVEIFNEATT